MPLGDEENHFHCTDVGTPLARMQIRKRHSCQSALGHGLGCIAWDRSQASLPPPGQLCAGTGLNLYSALLPTSYYECHGSLIQADVQ